jgi:hypothetical protein
MRLVQERLRDDDYHRSRLAKTRYEVKTSVLWRRPASQRFTT